ncbi:ABC transporter substrate-binding protein [Jiangella alkaliphila]|uniref:Iron complex transport system substrate-binding protein n=1 Tax=Jiangella alkaliphila TaxID=419479 RepID=A0A1H2KGU8_9ACTN|nr:ABC transporter substrate-binding protein [Jiangella alkaliphila]SDU67812.1 iron complex transport system substrate-binding protein [Jiangella alkaliphila]
MRYLPAAVALVLLAAACGTDDDTTEAAATAGDHPVTVENCGVDVTFDAPPERVVLLESAPATIMHELGVLDAAVLRAGAFPEEYYDDETNAAIAGIESLGEDLDTSGHLQISQEVIIAQQPDLVMGLPDGITREGLDGVGINALMQPVYCPEGVDATTFDDVYEQIETYGQIFDRADEADALVSDLQDRVAAVEAAAEGAPERTAAVLYPTVGGGSGYAYGNRSMAHPQLEAAGFSNVFGDVDERVFEVSLEQVLAADPDVLILLYVDGDPAAVKDAVVSLPGAEDLRAVQNDDILVQLFNFTEPPTPLSIDGLERIAEQFGVSP